MYEVWDILSQDIPEELKKTFLKPEFPTRRWGQITTKVSTTDKKALQKCQSLIEGKSRISIDHFNTEKFKSKFYKIEVYER